MYVKLLELKSSGEDKVDTVNKVIKFLLNTPALQARDLRTNFKRMDSELHSNVSCFIYHISHQYSRLICSHFFKYLTHGENYDETGDFLFSYVDVGVCSPGLQPEKRASRLEQFPTKAPHNNTKTQLSQFLFIM